MVFNEYNASPKLLDKLKWDIFNITVISNLNKKTKIKTPKRAQ